jgi:hypothetical protein
MHEAPAAATSPSSTSRLTTTLRQAEAGLRGSRAIELGAGVNWPTVMRTLMLGSPPSMPKHMSPRSDG